MLTPYIDPSILSIIPSQLPNTFTPGTPLIWTSTNGAFYLFGSVGDVIADHVHTEGQSHMIVVLHGTISYAVTASDGTVTTTQYTAPAVVIVPPDATHSVTSVSAAADGSGPNTQDLNTVSAFTFHQLMSNIEPASIIGKINQLTTPIQNLITQLNGALALTKTIA